MWNYLARRIVIAIPSLLGISLILFTVLALAPGDPFSALMENPGINDAVRATWRHSYGLDRPLGEQYLRYVASVARGDLGFSFSLQRPVSDALASAMAPVRIESRFSP